MTGFASSKAKLQKTVGVSIGLWGTYGGSMGAKPTTTILPILPNMHTFKRIILLGLVLWLGSTAAWTQEEGTDAEEAAIRAAIENYAKGADAQDAARIARSLHPESTQYLFTGQGVTAFGQAQYLGLIENKRIGGKDRTIEIESIDVTEEALAAAKVILTHDDRVFLHYMGLLKLDGAWQIMSIVTAVGRANP